jgi:hypothetical protein
VADEGFRTSDWPVTRASGEVNRATDGARPATGTVGEDVSSRDAPPFVSRDSTVNGFRILVYILLAAAFTSMIIQYSRTYGRALVGPLYDDVFYLSEGLEYAQLFQTQGVKACLARMWVEPPHSPFATLVTGTSFVIFGPTEWAPYALMGLIVLTVMFVADRLLNGLPLHARIAGVLFTLSVPIMGTLPYHFRPDATAGLVTGLGAVLMLRYSPYWAPRRHQMLTGLCFALALLVKTPSFPFTIYMFVGSWVAAALWSRGADLLDPSHREMAERQGWWAAMWPYCLPVLLLAGPYYAVAGGNVARYVYVNVLGQQKEMWLRQDSWRDLVRYVWDGHGGQLMIGQHGYLVMVLAVVTGLAYVGTGHASAHRSQLKVGFGFGAVLFLAWLMPTASRYGNPFIGSTFAAILLFVGVLLLRALFLLDQHWSRRSRGRAPIGIVLGWVAVATALLAFNWPEKLGTKTTDWVVTDNRVEREVYRAIKEPSAADGHFGLVYVTSAANLNGDLLRFRALTDQLPLRFSSLAYSTNVSEHVKAIEGADYVVAGDQGTFRWTHVPSYKVQGQILEALKTDAGLRLLATVPAHEGLNFYVFGRTPAFGGWTVATGLGPLEGPYAPAGNRMVRWGLGPTTVLISTSASQREGLIELTGLTMSPGQAVELAVNGVAVAHITFEIRDGFRNAKIPVRWNAGSNRVELRYAVWNSHANDARSMAVLFKELRVN